MLWFHTVDALSSAKVLPLSASLALGELRIISLSSFDRSSRKKCRTFFVGGRETSFVVRYEEINHGTALSVFGCQARLTGSRTLDEHHYPGVILFESFHFMFSDAFLQSHQ